MEIFTYRDTIENWIRSSKTIEQLRICNQAVEHFILQRFSQKESAAIVAETISYLANEILHQEKLLPKIIPAPSDVPERISVNEVEGRKF